MSLYVAARSARDALWERTSQLLARYGEDAAPVTDVLHEAGARLDAWCAEQRRLGHKPTRGGKPERTDPLW